MSKPLAVFLMGPTASGKTGVAVELVRRLPCAIVSVDSAMVFRGMDIGTAKPTPDVLAQAPHRLIDIVDPANAYSAAQFRTDALREMGSIAATGQVPLLVGGTGLYFRALERGLSPLPSANPAVRRGLSAEAERSGWPSLHARLAQVDRASAARIHRNDPQRIQRALEVFQLTGRPMSALFRERSERALPYRLLKVVLLPPDREELHARIAARFREMLKDGFVDEVAGLRARGDLHLGLPSMRAVGYRQVWLCLDGRYDAKTMTDKAVAATRQLAKRQMTWLRNETKTGSVVPFSPNLVDNVLKLLERAFARD